MEEKFILTDQDPNIAADAAFGVDWRDTWTYRCPSNIALVLSRGCRFSTLMYDSADVEYVAPDAQVAVEVRSPGGSRTIRLLGPGNYVRYTEFQNRNLIYTLDLDKPVIVKPRDLLVVRSLDSLGMDAPSIANSHFELQCTKVSGDMRGLPSMGSTDWQPRELCQEADECTQTNSVAAALTVLFSWQAELGDEWELRPGDAMCLNLVDAAPGAAPDGTICRLLKRDAAGAGHETPITGDILYASCQEFQNKNSVFTLPISAPVRIGEQEFLELHVNDPTNNVVAANSWASIGIRARE